MRPSRPRPARLFAVIAAAVALGGLLAAPAAHAAVSAVTGQLTHPTEERVGDMQLYVYTDTAVPRLVSGRSFLPVEPDGTFRITGLAPGSYLLCWSGEFSPGPPLRYLAQCLGGVSSADKESSTPFTVTKGGTTELGTIPIERMAQTSGQVRDPAGRPLEGVLVCGRPVEDVEPGDRDWYETCNNGFDYTDREGRYSVYSRSETSTALAFSTKDGLWAKTFLGNTAELAEARLLSAAGDTRATINVRMQPRDAAVVSGRAFGGDGRQLKRVGVRAYDLDRRVTTTSDSLADGTYRLGLDPGRYELTASAADHEEQVQRIVVGAEDVSFDLTMVAEPEPDPDPDATSVALRVTMGGEPVDEARIELQRVDSEDSVTYSTGPDGRRVVRGLEPGTYGASAFVDGMTERVPLTVRDTGRTTFTLKTGGKVTGIAGDLGVQSVRNVTRPGLERTPVVGSWVTVDRGEWSPQYVVTRYQWLRNGQPIVGATDRAYKPTVADKGRRLSVQVTASSGPYAPTTVESVGFVVQPRSPAA